VTTAAMTTAALAAAVLALVAMLARRRDARDRPESGGDQGDDHEQTPHRLD
jgi:MYXO-CTERM domain-containing protein